MHTQIKIFYQTLSVIQVQHEFRIKYECRKAPSRSAINSSVNKFEILGAMVDKQGSVSKKEDNKRKQ
jgi:hypothetical protein